MATPSEPGTPVTAAQLLTGILADAQELLRQQLALFRIEVYGELQRAKEAGALLAAGAVIAMVGVVLLCFMAVHLLSWALPETPLWVCYALVGGPVAAFGTVLCLVGLRQFGSIGSPRELPVPSLTGNARSLEEDVNG